MKLYINTKKICLFKSVVFKCCQKKNGKRESTCLSVWIKKTNLGRVYTTNLTRLFWEIQHMYNCNNSCYRYPRIWNGATLTRCLSSKPCLFSKQSEEVEAKTNDATFFIKQVGQKSTTLNENSSLNPWWTCKHKYIIP